MIALSIVAGSALILLVLADLLSATLAVANPHVLISQRVANAVWRVVLRRRPSHLVLRLTGEVIVAGIVAGWALLLWVGWSLVFLGAGDAVVDSTSGVSASASERIFFAGYLMSTLGLGGVTAATTGWRILAVLASLSGLMTVTLAVTFLVPVVSGVVQRRQVAATIAAVGRTPAALLERAWDGTDFNPLEDLLSGLFSDITMLTQRHLAYPVLHYFHAQQRHVAIAPMIAALDEALLVLHAGVRDAGVSAVTMAAVRNAVHELLGLLQASFVVPHREAPPFPDLEWVRRLGAGTVDDATFADACDECDGHRRLLRGFVEADGWSWSDVVEDGAVGELDAQRSATDTADGS